MAVVHRAQNALGLGLGVEIEFVMDGAHGEIEALQDLVRQIERAVSQDVDLGGFQDVDAMQFVVEAVDLIELL